MENRSMFVGLDVHKETIDVSIVEGHREGDVRHYGVIASDLEPLDKVVRALRAPGRRLHVVYEAGPCGFGIHRHLTKRGEAGVVVSPSMVPQRSGDRVKTDRRDSLTLARLHRAGELRPIYVPDAGDEAMRDLVRARENAVVVGTQAKYRLNSSTTVPVPSVERMEIRPAPITHSLVQELATAGTTAKRATIIATIRPTADWVSHAVVRERAHGLFVARLRNHRICPLWLISWPIT